MRKIRFDDGVFNKIMGTDREISSYDRFINAQKGIRSERKVLTLVDYYKSLVDKHRNSFEELSQLEDLIILYRIKSNKDIQLYIQREYIYARQSCPRDTKNRDIRVCVGRVDAYPTDIDVLKDEGVMNKAEDIITEYLDQLIREKEYIVQTIIPKLNSYAERSIPV